MFKKTILLLSLAFAITSQATSADSVSFTEGVEYLKIEKIPEFENQVVEFVWFSCAMCEYVQPKVHEIDKKYNGIVNQHHVQFAPFMKVPASFAFAARGLFPDSYKEIFSEYLKLGQTNAFDDLENYYKVLTERGVSKYDVNNYLSKQSTKQEMAHVKSLEDQSLLTGTPSFVIDGEYILNIEKLKNWDQAFDVIRFLIEKEIISDK